MSSDNHFSVIGFEALWRVLVALFFMYVFQSSFVWRLRDGSPAPAKDGRLFYIIITALCLAGVGVFSICDSVQLINSRQHPSEYTASFCHLTWLMLVGSVFFSLHASVRTKNKAL